MVYLFLSSKSTYYKSLKPTKPWLYVSLCLWFIDFVIRYPFVLQFFFKCYIKSRYSFWIFLSFNLPILHTSLYQEISKPSLYLNFGITRACCLVYNRTNFVSLATSAKNSDEYDIKKRRFSWPISAEYSIKPTEILKINDIIPPIIKYVIET